MYVAHQTRQGDFSDLVSCAGEMEVDILEFQVPVENNKTLFVWDIQPSHTEAQIYVSPPAGILCQTPFKNQCF